MENATYSHLRQHLAEVWDQVENGRTPLRVKRRGHRDMALLPADELASLEETVHLLRSPRNAARLFAALARSAGPTTPSSDPTEQR